MLQPLTTGNYNFNKYIFSEEHVLEILSNSHEFSKYRSKLEDRKILNALNKETGVKYKVKGVIDTYNKKAFVLLQAALANITIDRWEVRQQQTEILNGSGRVLNCVKEFYKEKNDARGYIQTIFLKRSLLQRMWNDSDLVARQLPKIGDKLVKNLQKIGINSFDKIASENPRKLEAVCGKNAPFGNILIDLVKSIPVIDLRYEILKVTKYLKLSMSVSLPYKRLAQQDDFDPYSTYRLIVCDCKNAIIFKKKLKPNGYGKNIYLTATGISAISFPLNIHMICEKYIGLDKLLIINSPEDKNGTSVKPGQIQKTLNEFRHIKPNKEQDNNNISIIDEEILNIINEIDEDGEGSYVAPSNTNMTAIKKTKKKGKQKTEDTNNIKDMIKRMKPSEKQSNMSTAVTQSKVNTRTDESQISNLKGVNRKLTYLEAYSQISSNQKHESNNESGYNVKKTQLSSDNNNFDYLDRLLSKELLNGNNVDAIQKPSGTSNENDKGKGFYMNWDDLI